MKEVALKKGSSIFIIIIPIILLIFIFILILSLFFFLHVSGDFVLVHHMYILIREKCSVWQLVSF